MRKPYHVLTSGGPVPTLKDFTASGVIEDQIFIDACYLPYQWVLLVAVNQDNQVINWTWAGHESKAAYQQLLEPLAKPLLVTCDGAKAASKAIHAAFHPKPPRIQRCLIHIHCQNLADLTRNPKTLPGKLLKHLSHEPITISTQTQAINWLEALNQFGLDHHEWLNQRTYAYIQPQEIRQRYAGKTWWYTHGRDRTVYARLLRLAKSDTLFAYLDSKLLSKTLIQHLQHNTNPVESINAQIKQALRNHQGINQTHMHALVEWTLYKYTPNPKPAHQNALE